MAPSKLAICAPRHVRFRLIAAAAAVFLSAPLLAGPSDAQPDQFTGVGDARSATPVGLLPATRPKARIKSTRGRPREVGMRIRAKANGRATGIRYFKPSRRASATPTHATLWSAKGTKLARTRLKPTRRRGWQRVTFTSPVRLTANKTFVVSIHRKAGRHPATRRGFDRPRSNAWLSAPARRNGWAREGRTPRFPNRATRGNTNFWVDVRFVPTKDVAPSTQTPPPTQTPNPNPPPAASGSWPGAHNTGVPAGTTLTPYAGPCTITSPRTISAVDATSACDALVINTKGVLIEKSLVPRVQSIFGDGNSSVTITDSDIRAGQTSTGALWGYNITASRVDATGGQHSFHCNNNCTLTDSWLHDQYNPDGGSYHNNAFISNGGSNMLLRHNTLHCTALLNSTDGGCTADVSLFGDFSPISRVTVDNNLLKANASSISYCAYGGHSPGKPYPVATGIAFTNNVFERGTNRRCGVYGPVTSFQTSASGNVWSGNLWDSGGAVSP